MYRYLFWVFFRSAIGHATNRDLMIQLSTPWPDHARVRSGRGGAPFGAGSSASDATAWVAVTSAHGLLAPFTGAYTSTNVLLCQVLNGAGVWSLGRWTRLLASEPLIMAARAVAGGKIPSCLAVAGRASCCSPGRPAGTSLRTAGFPQSVRFEGRTVLRAQ